MAGKQGTKKAWRRDAAKVAVARAASANRRRHVLSIVLAGIVSAGLIVAAVVVFGGLDTFSSDDSSTSSGNNGEFPPLPKGADKALATKPKVEAGSGELTSLQVKTLVKGKGPAAKDGQTMTINYVGVSYQTGEEFDSSWERGSTIDFEIGAGRVIPGFEQGLKGARLGSRVQIDIPPDLAYGDNAGGGAPSGPLRFVVDVLALKDSPNPQ